MQSTIWKALGHSRFKMLQNDQKSNWWSLWKVRDNVVLVVLVLFAFTAFLSRTKSFNLYCWQWMVFLIHSNMEKSKVEPIFAINCISMGGTQKSIIAYTSTEQSFEDFEVLCNLEYTRVLNKRGNLNICWKYTRSARPETESTQAFLRIMYLSCIMEFLLLLVHHSTLS